MRIPSCFAVLCLTAGTVLATTYTVTTAADSGAGSLRQAILDANTNLGADTIAFNIPGTDSGCSATGVCTIAPLTPLPPINEAVTIDGFTQTGASPNTIAKGAVNAVLKIVLSGVHVPGTTALWVSAAGTTLRGLVFNGGFDYTIEVYFADNTSIKGCVVGADASGMTAVPNNRGINAVFSDHFTLGGPLPADRNIVSGNSSWGIGLGNDPNATVQGNLIGTDATGAAPLGNGNRGILINPGRKGTVIRDNVISANGDVGLNPGDLGTDPDYGTVIQGNFIGTDVTGTVHLGNKNYGIFLTTNQVTVGGAGAGEGNVIAFNGSAGIAYYANDGTGSSIRGNSIYENGSLGIDLGIDGVTANDAGDADTGSNNLQNYPVVSTVTASSIQGTLNSEANKTYTLDFYANPNCDASGFGQGKTYLGSTDVSTDGGGNASFNYAVSVPPGQMVTATATGPDGSTSEFSRCANLLPAFLDADPTAGATSDGNGVFEPGETATVRPNWLNPTAVAFSPLTSGASALTGPAGASYSTVDGSSDYGSIPPHATGSCSATSNCFTMFVSKPSTRPAAHWDATFTETLSSPRDGAHAWKLHLGDSFKDVPRSQLFYKKIETVFHNAITVGCTVSSYCPDDDVPRDQMAIFLARAIAGGGANVPVSGSVGGKPYNCAPGGVSLYADVSPTSIACKSIHYIAAQNVTTGCSAGLYCPTQLVTRAQMAIFVAKGTVAPAGGAGVPLAYTDPVTHVSYSCDAASPNSLFADVTPADSFCKHVNYLYAKNIIAGCFYGSYCPNNNVTRGEMAKFLSNAFSLQLYGP
ncbi:MAG: S-layer homology domain-containing protein [Acidobacteriota bacterium]